MSKTWIEVSKNAILSNYAQFRSIVGNKKILAVLKSNAYGHGLKEVSSILASTDADFFGVDNANEAIFLSNLNLGKPILILGFTPLDELKELIEKEISFSVYEMEHLKKIVSLNLDKPAKIHLKIDTGMHRQGIFKNEVEKIINFILENKEKITLEGVSTHYADVKNPPDFDFTKKQLEYFNEVKTITEKLYKNKILFHTAATGATLLYESTYMDMVRVGIGLYGYWPSAEVKEFLKDKNIVLSPALTWKSLVAQVKEIEANESVSYSRTWTAKQKTIVAVIPIGYHDGFDRALSNKGEVLIKGKVARVLGRVCMNIIVVDVSEIPSTVLGDEVVLLGSSNVVSITAENIADKIETISYEVLARLNPNIEKRIVK